VKTRGFTLIEVLVALAIVAVGMSAVLGAMTSSADTAIYLRDKSFAQWIALNRIAEVRLKGQLPAKGKSEGDVDFAEGKWHWQQEVLPLQVKGMWRIDVSVRPVGKSTTWYTTESGVMGEAIKYDLNQLVMDRAQAFPALPQ
jgi:general secretion pathway protein I